MILAFYAYSQAPRVLPAISRHLPWRVPLQIRTFFQNSAKLEIRGFGTYRAHSLGNERAAVMNQAETYRYKTVLMAKHAEIAGAVPQRDELWIVQSNEQIETVQLAGQREFVARRLERETKSLMQISAALQRIDTGVFGICLDCDEPISAKRLAAVPWAAYCLHCQEARDAEQSSGAFEPLAAA